MDEDFAVDQSGMWTVEVVLKTLLWVTAINTSGFIGALAYTRWLLSQEETKKNQIFRVSEKFTAPFKQELLQAVLSLVIRSVFFTGAFVGGAIKFHDFHLGWTLIVAAVTYIFTEIWFYGVHRLLHTKALFWMHRPHHLGQVTRPVTGAAFGSLETVIILAGNLWPLIIFSHAVPWLSLPYFAFFLFFKDMNNFLDHMNVDLYPAGYFKSWKSKFFNAPTYHALHHARYRGNYAQSSPWLDKLFGTMYLDTEWAFEKVKSGQGLVKTNERRPSCDK